MTEQATGWRVRGTYFESWNRDAICPCRRVDGVGGGRSTHGVCMGVLSWLIEEGGADGTDLSGLPVALAVRYSDDEAGSPGTGGLYLDGRGGRAVAVGPLPRRAGGRRAASRARGNLQRPSRRGRAVSLSVGLEGQRA